MKKNVLVIVDMQNDFITGSLANPDAQRIVKPICDFITKREKPWDEIIVTRDSHGPTYLSTPEGKKLPVEHCINGTAGWCVEDSIQRALREEGYCYIDKPQFGSLEWTKPHFDRYNKEDVNIYLVGTCTDICVVSNALIMKAAFPKANIIVIGDLCAGLTKEKHEAALEVMRSCQIEVL